MIQYFINAGAKFPLLGELENILREATLEATRKGPLRHNAVETFTEKNTGTNNPNPDNAAPMAGPKIIPKPKAAPSSAKFWVRFSRGVMSAR